MVYITPYHAMIIYALRADTHTNTDTQHIPMHEPEQFQETRCVPAVGQHMPGLINNKAT